jgi:hypothetical protein
MNVKPLICGLVDSKVHQPMAIALTARLKPPSVKFHLPNGIEVRYHYWCPFNHESEGISIPHSNLSCIFSVKPNGSKLPGLYTRFPDPICHVCGGTLPCLHTVKSVVSGFVWAILFQTFTNGFYYIHEWLLLHSRMASITFTMSACPESEVNSHGFDSWPVRPIPTWTW